MKSIVTMFSLIAMFTTATAQADSAAISTLKSLNLHEYYCDVAGSTQSEPVFKFSSANVIFAQDKNEAIKLCLLKIGALAVTSETGELSLVATGTTISKDAVIVNKISIRDGMMK